MDTLSFRSVVRFLLLLVLATSGTILCAQTVTIKLVNGRNGRPVAATCVFVSVENDPSTLALLTDKDGDALLRLTNDNDSREKDCGLHSAIKIVVKYGDSLSIGVDHYLICQPRIPNYSRMGIQDISTKRLMTQGIITPNTCGKFTASPKPGELTIFVRPLSWYERFWGGLWE